LTKMVNVLATKLELGSPMICLYLLQNPDHYSSHRFVPFYWKTFVMEARKVWYPQDIQGDNKVVLIKKKGKLIGLSSTYDYTHWPEQHTSMYLYDWICRFTRAAKRSGKQDIPDQYANNTEKLESDQSAPTINTVLRYMEGHPLAQTHAPVATRNWQYVVPNFIGPPLPRPDKEDCEFYCCTILALFKPWRTGKDLKADGESWHEAFENYKFGDMESFYIKNMNLRYECLDARDDFRSQMK
ncbi:hypothetical protein BDP27DRAFT_1181066, partial [Rhodocollybia butyracea]